MSNRYLPVGVLWVLILTSGVEAQEIRWGIMPEQRSLSVRSPEQLRPAGIPRTPAPATVNSPLGDVQDIPLSLSVVLNRSLGNMDAVRVLSGVNANSTGRTIYDVGINNTGIDSARGAFDPNLNINNNFLNGNSPGAIPDPGDPTQTLIVGSRSDRNNFNMNLSKRMLTGGVIDFGVIGGNNRFPGLTLPLNPQLQSNAALQLTQPLLQGAGLAVNHAPIVIAQLDTERSYFQFKDSVQSHVESIVQGYWNLVQARTDLWARKQQVALLEFAVDQADAELETGNANFSAQIQQRVAIENFRANVLVAEGNLLQRESALRNVLGLSPFDNDRIIPITPLIDQKITWDWNELLSLAEQYRPDIIELKLILEADQQRMLIRNNDARPSLDAVALYRWNGLEGTMPNGSEIRGTGFEDWSLGVNFSVPLGLRAARAGLRQQELLIQRDQVNLQQGLHQAAHNLAIRVRNLELFFAQYERFQKVREAATDNLRVQTDLFKAGNEKFIVVLQAVVDWGNAVSNEAQSLVQYNAELAALERETGTILETHGIAFVEERFGSIGPLGRLAVPVEYPGVLSPGGENGRYPNGNRPSEQQFRLEPPVDINDMGEQAPGELPPPPAELPLPNQQPAPVEAIPPLGSSNKTPAGNPPRVSDNKSLTPSLFRYSSR
ncbi:MAG: TolC family protein [Pirellulaceae bacterium]|nr:TolC family protein [Pirellulaceae bacterium]